jgi:cell wall-associated NlpC family hydrolase
MKTELLLGLPYRLGATPDKHHAADCVSLAGQVIRNYGIDFPTQKRHWYRRLRKKDYKVFSDELKKWGRQTTTAKIGVVALCKAEKGYGMAVYWKGGWLSFVEKTVRWSPLTFLEVLELYYPMK